jgi:hypothetical protein
MLLPSSGSKSKPSKKPTSVPLLAAYFRDVTFSLCSSCRVRDQVPLPYKAIRILDFGNYKTRINRCNVRSIKQEVMKMASSGFKQYNGTWRTLFGAAGQDQTTDNDSGSTVPSHATNHEQYKYSTAEVTELRMRREN